MRRMSAVPLVLLALVVAACGGASPSGSTGGPGASTPSASDVGASPGDGSQSSGPASGHPATTPPPSAAGPASPGGVTPPPPSDGATPTDSGAPSASASGLPLPCSPEGTNPDFWPGIAGSVGWDVYCAVLPKDWIVSAGKYRLANGGYLEMSYKGPGGATLSLSEGSFCTDGTGCVPSGSDVGSAQFGALQATLVATDAGGFAIVAARGEQPSWLMVTSGLDQATAVSLGAALAHVGG